MDLERLRKLAEEPERTGVTRGRFPSMTSEVLRQKQEIGALRRGLREAIAEIELDQSRLALLKRILTECDWARRGRAGGTWIDGSILVSDDEFALMESIAGQE